MFAVSHRVTVWQTYHCFYVAFCSVQLVQIAETAMQEAQQRIQRLGFLDAREEKRERENGESERQRAEIAVFLNRVMEDRKRKEREKETGATKGHGQGPRQAAKAGADNEELRTSCCVCARQTRQSQCPTGEVETVRI
eukprot:Skav235799  [mRNA]  locus=scaffold1267:173416:174729:- [translate_table: standard]